MNGTHVGVVPYQLCMWERQKHQMKVYSLMVHPTKWQLTKCQADEIVKLHPNYSAFTNSCQNFVLYLLEFACPDSDITNPKTFVKALTTPIWDRNTSRTRKRTGTKFNDSIQGNRSISTTC